MSPVHKSGAFLQQCFAVHPLSLDFKLFSLPNTVGILCTNCQMRHRIKIDLFSTFLGESHRTSEHASEYLARCAAQHPTSLRITNVEITDDRVQVRCRECKRGYQLDIGLFETQQT